MLSQVKVEGRHLRQQSFKDKGEGRKGPAGRHGISDQQLGFTGGIIGTRAKDWWQVPWLGNVGNNESRIHADEVTIDPAPPEDSASHGLKVQAGGIAWGEPKHVISVGIQGLGEGGKAELAGGVVINSQQDDAIGLDELVGIAFTEEIVNGISLQPLAPEGISKGFALANAMARAGLPGAVAFVEAIAIDDGGQEASGIAGLVGEIASNEGSEDGASTTSTDDGEGIKHCRKRKRVVGIADHRGPVRWAGRGGQTAKAVGFGHGQGRRRGPAEARRRHHWKAVEQ